MTNKKISNLKPDNGIFYKKEWTKAAFVCVDTQSLSLQTDLTVIINDVPYNFLSESAVIMPDVMLAGNDYGIFATIDDKLIATYTVPSPEPYGGFNCL